MTAPNPEFRRMVHELIESLWDEPFVVVYLNELKPYVEVPGRRKDGTIMGQRLVRRFFWNILRGTVGGLVSLVLSVLGGGIANMFERSGKLTGPANSQALELLDAARPADGPWLACSPTRLAIVDTGSAFTDPADAPPPTILWQATRPNAPDLHPYYRTLTWPDGSVLQLAITGKEARLLKALTDN